MVHSHLQLQKKRQQLLQSGDVKQAAQLGEELAKLAPSAALLYEQGALYFSLEQPTAALANFEKALALQPNFRMALEGIGKVYLKFKNQNTNVTDTNANDESDISKMFASFSCDTPQTLGRYKIIKELGKGGMGTVFLAYDQQLKREVALKTLRSCNASMVKRFTKEAKALASLSHPNIGKIYDIGNEDKVYYFAMDYVAGKDLKEVLQQSKMSFRRAVEIVRKIALAIDYAHSQGILHRDLKPANIMINAQGEPLVLDFGLAREQKSETRLSQSGMAIGTPSYMPPEQALGQLKNIDERSDVYALGVVLYELLTGTVPFRGLNLHAIIIQIVEKDPVAPRMINEKIPRDVESICLKALEKDKGHRYQSAQELARDLERFINGEPIAAVQVSMVDKIVKWLAKNKTITLVSGLFLFGFLLLGAISYWQIHNEVIQTQKALVQAQQAKKRAYQATLLAEKAKTAATEALVWSQLKMADRYWDQGSFQYAAVVNAAAIQHEKNISPSLGLFARHKLAMRFAKLPRLQGVIGEKLYVMPLVLSSNGKLMAYGRLKNVYLRDIQAQKNFAVLKGHTTQIVSLAFSYNNKFLASADKRLIKVWDIAKKQATIVQNSVGAPTDLTFSPDNKLLLWINAKTNIKAYHVATGEIRNFIKSSDTTAIRFSPDGRYFVYVSQGKIHILNTHTQKSIILNKSPIFAHVLKFSSDSKFLASIRDEGRSVIIWDMSSFTQLYSLNTTRLIFGIAFSPDNQKFVTCGVNEIALYKVLSGDKLSNIAIGKGKPSFEIFWHDTMLVWGYWQLKIHFGKVNNDKIGLKETLYFGHGGGITSVAFHPGGKFFAAGSERGLVHFWEIRERKIIYTFPEFQSPIRKITFSKNGIWIAIQTYDKNITLWEVKTRQLQQKWAGQDLVNIAFYKHFLIAAQKDVTIWDALKNRKHLYLPFSHGKMIHLAFDPQGYWVVGADMAGNIWQLQVEGAKKYPISAWNKKHVKRLLKYRCLFKNLGRIRSIATTAHLLAIATDYEVLLAKVDTKTILSRLKGHFKPITCLAFSADEKSLISGSRDKTMRIWDLNGELKTILYGHYYGVSSIAFHPHSHSGILVSAANKPKGFGDATTIRIWDLKTSNKKHHLNSETISSFAINNNQSISGGQRGLLHWHSQKGLIKSVNLRNIMKQANIRQVVFHNKHKLLALGIFQKEKSSSSIALFTSTRQLNVIGKFNGLIKSLQFSHDGSYLLSSGNNKTLDLWNIDKKEHTRLFQHRTSITCARFVPGSKQIVFGDVHGRLYIWDFDTRKIIVKLREHSDVISDIVFLNDHLMATASYDRKIRLWNLDLLKCQKVLYYHKNKILSLSFNPKRQLLASGSENGHIYLWHTGMEKVYSFLRGQSQEVKAIQFNTKGDTLISGGKELIFWDIKIAKKFLQYTPKEIEKYIWQITGHQLKGNNVVFHRE